MAKKEVKCATCSVEFFSYNTNPKYCSKNCKDTSLRHDVDFEEIVELYESGMTQHEVALALGTTQKVIYSRMKDNGYLPRAAYKRNQLGENNSYWRGGKSISSHGYVYIKSPGHPRANNSGDYVFEHIIVAEDVLGRFLTNEEVVHHINGMKTDNRVCNLYLTTKSEHTRMHNLGVSHDVVSNLLIGEDVNEEF